MGALQDFARIRHEGRALAAAAKAAGGKVIGYMGATVPVELFDAAGVTAAPIGGDLDAPTPLADRYMESLFDPRVRAALQSVLAGEWDMLDLIVLPRTSDSLQRCYYYLCELRRMGHAVPPAKLYDLLHTPGAASVAYNFERTGELQEAVEAVAGQPIESEALRRAISQGNRRRSALQKLVALRRRGRLGGVDALNAFAASRLMPVEAFEQAVAQVVADAALIHGPRVVVAGSAQERTALHALIESLGGVVVGDFHDAGEPMLGDGIDEDAEPRAEIARHYHAIPSSRTFPSDAQAVTAFARAAEASGVVFYYDAEEEALTWDLPAQRRSLEGAGIKVIAFTDQPRHFERSAIEPALAAMLVTLPRDGADG
jgi:benzoyl-CoA reductase/2-hydroxyglutaryl-CoA dehydratase subunit BcrC/BadD/HgdB